MEERFKRNGYSQGWMLQQLIAMENRRARAGKKAAKEGRWCI